MENNLALTFAPLTPQHWDAFETLFGERGACGGCWCMWFRVPNKEFEGQKGLGNKAAMYEIVHSGRIPGILAFHNNEAVGWCSVAPREEFSRLQRSRILQPVDELPVWSVVCLFVRKDYRRKGVSTQLLQSAIDYVKSRGGSIVEGYPVDAKGETIPDAFAYYGLASSFLQAGYEEVARRSEIRPIMRYVIQK